LAFVFPFLPFPPFLLLFYSQCCVGCRLRSSVIHISPFNDHSNPPMCSTPSPTARHCSCIVHSTRLHQSLPREETPSDRLSVLNYASPIPVFAPGSHIVFPLIQQMIVFPPSHQPVTKRPLTHCLPFRTSTHVMFHRRTFQHEKQHKRLAFRD